MATIAQFKAVPGSLRHDPSIRRSGHAKAYRWTLVCRCGFTVAQDDNGRADRVIDNHHCAPVTYCSHCYEPWTPRHQCACGHGWRDAPCRQAVQ